MTLQEALEQSKISLAIAPASGSDGYVLFAGPIHKDGTVAFEMFRHGWRSPSKVEGWPLEDVAGLASDPDAWIPVSRHSNIW